MPARHCHVLSCGRGSRVPGLWIRSPDPSTGHRAPLPPGPNDTVPSLSCCWVNRAGCLRGPVLSGKWLPPSLRGNSGRLASRAQGSGPEGAASRRARAGEGRARATGWGVPAGPEMEEPGTGSALPRHRGQWLEQGCRGAPPARVPPVLAAEPHPASRHGRPGCWGCTSWSARAGGDPSRRVGVAWGWQGQGGLPVVRLREGRRGREACTLLSP